MLKDGVSVLVSAEAFDIFSQAEDLKSCRVFLRGTFWGEPNDLSEDCESVSRPIVSAVPVVSAVLFSPSSVVTECFDDVSLDPNWEFVTSQSFFSKMRPFVGTVFQEIMRCEGSPVKASPHTRRRMMLSPPQQSSNSSYEEWQWQTDMEVEGSNWSAREKKVIAKLED